MRQSAKRALSAYAILLIGVSGCVPEDFATKTDATYGQQLFVESCAACHGTAADGNGTAALGLGIKPPRLTNLSAANNGIFPRDYVMSKIDGYSKRGHSGQVMPEFGAGDLGPMVQIERDGISTPVPADLVALANYVESIQK